MVVGTIDFFLLGPLEARQRERPLRLGSIKHRMLLAKLLLHPNQVVSTEELIEAVWGEEPPPTVKQSLQNHVAALRKAIEAGNGAGPPRTLVTRDPGYLLRVDPERLDLHRFQRLDREGRQALAAGDPARAADLLRQALALWRGPALADVAASADLAWPELVGVEELQVASTEARIEAELALGRHHELVAELEALVRLYPLREHLHGQLMLALYRSGRQADALAAYRAARKVLVDELGIEPSVGLSGWNRPSWPRTRPSTCWSRPARAAPAPRRPRRPRPRQRHLRRGRDRGAQARLGAVRRGRRARRRGRGATPRTSPACSTATWTGSRPRSRASAAPSSTPSAASPWPPSGSPRPARTTPSGPCGPPWPSATPSPAGGPGASDRAERDGVELRIAVTTGEALVTDGTRVAGDPVATCARLQQAAPSGTVLVSETTGRATERSISYGPASLLALAGQAKPMSVWSALEPRNRTGMDALAAGPVPLVGRDRELGILLEAFQRARPSAVPGWSPCSARPASARAGWWPSSGGPSTPTATWSPGGRAAPRPGTRAAPPPAAGDDPLGPGRDRQGRGRHPGDRLGRPGRPPPVQGGRPRHGRRPGGHRLGLGAPARAGRRGGRARRRAENGAVATANRDGRRDEAFTAWRRFLYGLANRRPLVLVLEDLHWADDALLDFLQELLEPTGIRPWTSTGAAAPRTPPEARCCWWPPPATTCWPAGRAGGGSDASAVAVELEPLSEADTGHLLETLLSSHRLPTGVGPALVAAAGGNLFAEEYVRMVRDRHPLPPGRTGRRGCRCPRPSIPSSPHASTPCRARRGRLRDLAVLGRSRLGGRLAAVSGRTQAEVEACLERLAAKGSLPGRARLDGRRARVRVPPRAGLRGRLRPDPAPGAGRQAPPGRRLAGSLASSAPAAGPPLRAGPGAGQRGRPGAGELAGGRGWALRDAGDRVSGLGVHITAARYYTQAWPSGRPTTPSARTSSSAPARPPAWARAPAKTSSSGAGMGC